MHRSGSRLPTPPTRSDIGRERKIDEGLVDLHREFCSDCLKREQNSAEKWLRLSASCLGEQAAYQPKVSGAASTWLATPPGGVQPRPSARSYIAFVSLSKQQKITFSGNSISASAARTVSTAIWVARSSGKP